MSPLISQAKIPRLFTQAFNRLSISQKICLGYGITLGVAFIGTVSGVAFGNHIQQAANQQRINIRNERLLLINLQNTINDLQTPTNLGLYLEKTKQFQQVKTLQLQNITKLRNIIAQVNTSASKSSIQTLKPLLTKNHTLLNEFPENLQISLKKIEPSTQQEKVFQTKKLLVNLGHNTNILKTSFVNELQPVITTAEQQEDQAEINLVQGQILQTVILLISFIFSMVIAGVLAIYNSRAIAKPIEEVADITQKVLKESNFQLQIPNTTTEKVGILAVYVNQLIVNIKQTQEAVDTANSAKTKFLAIMSHELRTPLNGILGYIQILETSQTLTDKEKHGISIIRKCSLHLLTLVNEILDVSKLESGNIKLDKIDFYLPSFLRGIVEICRLKAEDKGIEFIYEPPVNLPTGITTDEKRLRQVLINLISNAIKFTHQGKVILYVKLINSEKSLIKINFAVEDTGIGINFKNLEKIFLPFEQLEESKQHKEGIGLGLTISQKIVELMGSRIEVKSKLGVGSIFEFAIECPVPENWTESKTITTGGKIIGYSGVRKKILIVDDSWENRAVIVNLLEPLGFTLIEAVNGQEGLDKAIIYHPHLIISDLAMPVMDGKQMIQNFRKQPSLRNISIIISSATIFDEEKYNTKAIGGDDFLSKPIQIQQLYRLLTKYLQIHWIYAGNHKQTPKSEALKANTIVIPSVNDLATLIEYAKKGQIKGIQKELDKIALMDDKYKPWVNQLYPIVKSFNIKKVRQVLQENFDCFKN